MTDINYKNFIGTIPFSRIYTYHKNNHDLDKVLERYNIIDNKLEKIIIMSDKILMISYSDNNNAKYFYKLYKKNKDKNTLKNKIIKLVNSVLEKDIDIQIDDIRFVYWNEGIHYFKPQKNNSLKKIINILSNPYHNFYVCGEILSYKQGWVEGCIESVNRVIKLLK